MRWTRRAALAAGLALAATGGAGVLRAAPPEPPSQTDLPGQQAGALDCRWVAPWVVTIGLDVGGRAGARTVWYHPDGRVVRDVIGTGQDFVVVPATDGSSAVHGTRAEWSVALPPPPPGAAKLDMFHTASGDGRTFVRQQTDVAAATTSADVFVDGAFCGRVGPALRWRGRSLQAGEDGSVAFEAGRKAGERGMRVLVFAPGAKAACEVPCEADDWLASVAPAGKGVLIRRPKSDASDEALFGSSSGLRPVELGTNGRVVAWVPGAATALVTSGPDDAPRLRLVDLAAGTTLWDVADQPMRGRRGASGAAIEGDLVLVSGLEPHQVAGVSLWRRRVDALDLATGKPVASWHSADVGAVGFAEPAQLLRARGALYLVSRETFAAVPVADIRAKSNGWN